MGAMRIPGGPDRARETLLPGGSNQYTSRR